MSDQINEIDIEVNQDFDAPQTQDGPKEDPRFKEGQILRFVRVRFPGNAKSFPFLIGKRKVNYGQKVVAMSDRGVAVGYVNSFPYDVVFTQEMLPIRSINKLATDEDIQKEIETYKREKQVETLCQDLINKHNLEMNLTHVEFTQFGKKAVFYFIAPARVDFRELVKDLVNELKMRVELRQISVRDRAASVGGIGPCGRELCCSSFLSKYGVVNVKLAKNQDLTINYSKLNGVCGQLKCCLQYEDDVYAEKRKKLPEEGAIIETYNGEKGRVQRLHILSEQFDLLTIKGTIKRYVAEEFKDYLDNFNFPEQFDHITDETKVVIGLERSLEHKRKNLDHEKNKLIGRGKNFASETFTEIFGVDSFNDSLPEIEEPTSSKSTKVILPEEAPEVEFVSDEEQDLMDDSDSDEAEESVQTQKPHQHQRPQQQQARQDGGNRNNNNQGNNNHRHHHHKRRNNRNNNRRD